MGFLPDVQFGEGTESHVADLTATEGIVIALPLHHKVEEYEIPNELEVGDRVWFSYFGSLHGVDVFVGDEVFRLIEYQLYDSRQARRRNHNLKRLCTT